MDPLLLEYYNRELVYLKESAGEFAAAHPKIAKRLGMQGIDIADPYVERLIESFCYMSARMQIKLDAEFPKFTQRLLEVIYPNYVSPTPSIAVIQLHPSTQEGDFSKGITVPRDTVFKAAIPVGESTVCEFRSSQNVTLWPIEIVEAKLTGTPPDIPSLERYLPPHITVQGALRLRLRMNTSASFSDLHELDRLPIYLSGDERIASHLFELLHTSAVATFTGLPGKIHQDPHVVLDNALALEGFGTDEGLLPLTWNTFHGNNLLHEYFASPSRFYFFSLTGLAQGLKRLSSQDIEIVVLLSKPPTSLASVVDVKQFALFCTPVINLFRKKTDRIELNSSELEFHLVPNRAKPIDYEVYAVESIQAQLASNSHVVDFRPMFQTLNQDEGNFGRYFSLRRERRLPSNSTRKYGTRTPYIGTEVFVSLVDQHEAPYREDIRYLSVEAWLTNRDLPLLVGRNGTNDLSTLDSIPVKNIGFIRAPSKPLPPFAERENAWRLIRQLGFNYLPLMDLKDREGGQALRDMLRLFLAGTDRIENKQVQALIGSSIRPVTRRLPGHGPIIYGRGVLCTLTVDEDGFSGVSPYLFGLVLKHWLSRHVAINSFTQTELHSMQRGVIAQWDVTMGGRGSV